MGYSELLLESCGGDSPLRADVEQIWNTARRAAELTRQLLAFSRRQMVRMAPIDLPVLLRRLEGMLRTLLGEAVELTLHLEPDLWKVRGDAAQIEQVVMNLAVNARDAMAGGGKVVIEARNVTASEGGSQAASASTPARWVCLSVQDDGEGMEPEVMRYIFEPFYTTKEGEKGTGLGLSVVYGIVKQHEGWIEVDSKPGQGSTFRVYLPASTSIEVLGDEPQRQAEVRGCGEKVLVVEDDEAVRKLACRTLRGAGYAVAEASSCEGAREVFKRERGEFDVLVCDVVLPSGSGADLAAEFLSQRPGLAVILTSGHTDGRLQWLTLQEKGYEFLRKPFGPRVLLAAVAKSMRGRGRA
jgi:CheY-like chemotaxis protein/two-component sensor histidine kinase